MTLHDSFQYKKDLDNPAVLGCLEGPCADIEIPTRNGRKYCEKLWERVFQDEIVNEAFANGGLFGEAQHPVDREETDVEKIAIAMKEPPIRGKDNKLYGRFYILDTPCGRIMKTLCDFGYKWGISSRGSGDVEEDYDGTESVNPDTYHFETFDAVLLPAVKAARLTPVTEALGKNKTLRTALNEAFSTSDDNGKKIMSQLLEDLNIKTEVSSESEEEDAKSSQEEVVNDESIMNELQEALVENETLKKKVLELQEQLSVGCAKEISNLARISDLTSEVEKFSKGARINESNETKIKILSERLTRKKESADRQNEELNSVRQQLTESKETIASMSDRLHASEKKVKILEERLINMKKKLSSSANESSSLVESLQTEISMLKEESKVTSSHFQSKLNKSAKQTSEYKKLAESAVSRYINLKATQLGISSKEIRNRLTENYTLDDVDNICESLRGYRLNMSKLPFSLNDSSISKIALKDNKDSIAPANPDDIIDNSFADFT